MDYHSGKLENYAIVVNDRDNVAVAKSLISAGSQLSYKGVQIIVRHDIKRGHRFALRQIPPANTVIQYGQPFGTAVGMGIGVGEYVGDRETFSNDLPDIAVALDRNHQVKRVEYLSDVRTFEGYKRDDGRVGTRNYFLVIPVSFCANDIGRQIAEHYKGWDTKGVDGVFYLNNNGGCGCDAKRVELTTRILMNYARHPNVGGVLFIENGCENSRFSCFRGLFESYKVDKPVEWISLQENECKLKETVHQGISLVGNHLDNIGKASRQLVPLSSLILGTECGGSDSFSGLSGNLVLGEVSDWIVISRGSVILSEIPEFSGAQYLLAKRAKDYDTAKRILSMFDWYQKLAVAHGSSFEENPTPGNMEGGLINICIKSLGAVIKGGTTRVEGTIEYGELLMESGLNIMQGPGGDLESITGIAASGANIIGFTTGRGTPVGNVIVPTVKIANAGYPNNDIFDYNAGAVIDTGKTKEAAGMELLELIIEVASGKKTCAEKNDCRQFQIWPADSISL